MASPCPTRLLARVDDLSTISPQVELVRLSGCPHPLAGLLDASALGMTSDHRYSPMSVHASVHAFMPIHMPRRCLSITAPRVVLFLDAFCSFSRTYSTITSDSHELTLFTLIKTDAELFVKFIITVRSSRDGWLKDSQYYDVPDCHFGTRTCL